MYHEPCLSVRADGSVRCLQTRDEARRFFEGVSTAWRREEYERFETSDLEVVPIGQRCLLVTLDWHMLRGDGSLIRRWRQSYQLIMVAQDWQVLTSTFHAT
jgi:DNA-binding response OmpR family regulator